MRREAETVRSLLIVDDDLGFCRVARSTCWNRKRLRGAYHVDTAERAVAAMRQPPDGGERAGCADRRAAGRARFRGRSDPAPAARAARADLRADDRRHRQRQTAIERAAARRLRLFRQVPRPELAVRGARPLLRPGGVAARARGGLRGVAHRQGGSRGGQPRQIGLSRDDEPRVAHAAQRDHRVFRDDAARGAGRARQRRNTAPMPPTSTRAARTCCRSSTTSSICRRPRPASSSCTRNVFDLRDTVRSVRQLIARAHLLRRARRDCRARRPIAAAARPTSGRPSRYC